jgi:methionyl-tRNA formyltransferase
VKALLSRVSARRAHPANCWTTRCWWRCGEGAVRLLRVQREGRGAQDAAAFLNGYPMGAGARLADAALQADDRV